MFEDSDDLLSQNQQDQQNETTIDKNLEKVTRNGEENEHKSMDTSDHNVAPTTNEEALKPEEQENCQNMVDFDKEVVMDMEDEVMIVESVIAEVERDLELNRQDEKHESQSKKEEEEQEKKAENVGDDVDKVKAPTDVPNTELTLDKVEEAEETNGDQNQEQEIETTNDSHELVKDDKSDETQGEKPIEQGNSEVLDIDDDDDDSSIPVIDYADDPIEQTGGDLNGQCDENRCEKDDEGEEVEYIVERILNKKVEANGLVKYYVKWEGYPSSSNSWEPPENLIGCDRALEKFEFERARKLADKHGKDIIEGDNEDHEGNTATEKKNDRQSTKAEDYKLKEILGMTIINNDKYFLISLTNREQNAFIRAALANKMFPDKVIEFYTKQIQWKKKSDH